MIIANCLKSILEQSYPRDKIEIIVVDNNSSDRTKEIAKKYTDKVYNFGPERSAQRNFGAQQAKGEYYLYLDADMTLSPNVISINALEDAEHYLQKEYFSKDRLNRKRNKIYHKPDINPT